MKNLEMHHPADIFADVVQEMLDKYGKPPELPLTFLPELNNMVWGLKRKKLVVVGARTSIGKSAFLLNCLLDFIKQKKSVIFFTLEMTKESCVQRLINIYCGMNNFANLAGLSAKEHEKNQDKIAELYNLINDSKVVIIESFGKTVAEIAHTIDTLGTEIDIVMVDYIQNVSMHKQTERHSLDEYLKDLRVFAIKKNLCAIVASQINRGTFDSKMIKQPELHELKGSGAIEETADMVILLHWQHHYDKEEDNKNDYIVKVAKNRDGRTGVHECIYEPEFFRLREKTPIERMGKNDKDEKNTIPFGDFE